MRKKKVENFISSMKCLFKKSAVLSWARDLRYYLQLPSHREKIECDFEKDYEHLKTVSPEPNGTMFGKNEISDPVYDLTVVVPVYNVKDYLRDCMESILSQKTSYRYKVVLIDDGSTDGSGLIADEYKDNAIVEVIHQKNGGLSAARNAGLKKIESAYVCFVDSDDLMASGFIQSFLDAAKKENADIVEGGCYNFDESGYWMHHFYPRKFTAKSNDKLTGFAWGKIYKSSLLQNFVFPEGFIFEDTCLKLGLFHTAKRIVCIPKIGYFYRDNRGGITGKAKSNPRALDTVWITKMLVQNKDALNLKNESAFMEDLFNQFVVNYARTRFFDDSIKREIFGLSKELVKKADSPSVKVKRRRPLYKAIKSGDYGAYSLYMRTH